MTREDVLSGMKFKWNSSVYAASPDKNGDYLGGSLLLCIGNAQIYECNVSSFGPYAMHWFTYVMGRQVKGTINYKSLEAYVEAPQAVAA
jgi:hypothetical protein